MIRPQEVDFRVVGISGKAEGWLIGVGGICGNTFSYKYALVVPGKKGDQWEYHSVHFFSKEKPKVIRVNEDTRVLSTYQEWGCTGTALSFFVPEVRKIHVTARGESSVLLCRLEYA